MNINLNGMKQDYSFLFSNTKNSVNNNNLFTSINLSDYNSIKSFDTQEQKDATLREIESNPAYKTDDKLREIYNTLKAIKPKDVLKAQRDKNLQNWLKEYNALSGIPQSKWQKANPDKYKALREARLIK